MKDYFKFRQDLQEILGAIGARKPGSGAGEKATNAPKSSGDSGKSEDYWKKQLNNALDQAEISQEKADAADDRGDDEGDQKWTDSHYAWNKYADAIEKYLKGGMKGEAPKKPEDAKHG